MTGWTATDAPDDAEVRNGLAYDDLLGQGRTPCDCPAFTWAEGDPTPRTHAADLCDGNGQRL